MSLEHSRPALLLSGLGWNSNHMESNWRDSNSGLGVGCGFFFQILDSKGKKGLETLHFTFWKRNLLHPLPKPPLHGHGHAPASRVLCGGLSQPATSAGTHWQMDCDSARACARAHAHAHTRTHAGGLPTSHQLQSTACCSQGRWSSSKPTADGRTAPGSAYLPENRRP